MLKSFFILAVARDQEIDITSQLNLGIRLFQAQSHVKDGVFHFCHTSCTLFDGGPVVDYLKTVKSFIDANPNEVLTLIFTNPEGQSPLNVWKPAFDEAGISDLAFVPPSLPAKQSDWPTLGEMIDSGKRVVVFLDAKADDPDSVPFILPEFQMVRRVSALFFRVWNHRASYSGVRRVFDCDVAVWRMKAAYLLHICTLSPLPTDLGDTVFSDRRHVQSTESTGALRMSTTSIDAPRVNNADSINAHVAGCVPLGSNRNPSFVLIDFVNKGGCEPIEWAGMIMAAYDSWEKKYTVVLGARVMERPKLPVELLCHVLALLEVDDLIRCGAVNRYFRSLIRESSRLQFTLELAKHRMLSLLPPTEFPPFSTRLKLLRNRERNWRSPQHWSPLQKLALPPTGTVYEFVGGHYANGREDDNKITSGISFFELPSTEPTCSDAPLKTWTHAMGSIKIVDFTMDPAQDLLVLVALAPPQCDSVYQIHLRSFTTNEPHPESSLPMGVLPCLPKVSDHLVPLETTGAVRVQVAGDLIALLVKEVHDSVSAHLQIFNWRYGSHYSCAMARMAGIEDFTFLSDDTFLIVRPIGRFECYTFSNPIACSTVPELKSSYSLPPLQDGFMYWYICMSSNPVPGLIPHRESTGNRVYYPRPDERILACCLYIFKPTGPGDHHVHSFVFFLNTKMFLDPPSVANTRRNVHIYPVASASGSFHMALADRTAPSPSSPPISSSSRSQPQPQPQPQPDSLPENYPHPYQLFSPHPSFFTPVNIQQQAPFPPPPTQEAINRTRQMHLRSLLTSSGVQTVPWEQWGPANTRWFDEALSTDWQHALYGLKTVECIDPANPPRPVPTDPGEVGTQFDDDQDEAGTAGAPEQAESSPVPAGASPVDAQNLPTVTELLGGVGFEVVDDEQAASDTTRQRLGPAQRHLRIRDYNPFSLRLHPEEEGAFGEDEVEDEIGGAGERERERKGGSARAGLPVQVETENRHDALDDAVPRGFNVTDVMMDDCRVLLMQRGKGGKLKGIDVLTM
ncbi:F-box domain-containing protein [Mycena venus]|uniref:F-box domain-containing protein n=1 Tax=Mycena venus TaxID=2733690 RepID=A0A8H6YLN0_9AGAR|nr:F-box domain-containing protein [Mycena venus]